jgi:hypothetical protein
MSVEALMDLRKRVDEMLLGRRAELEKQLERIAVGGARVVRSRRVYEAHELDRKWKVAKETIGRQLNGA